MFPIYASFEKKCQLFFSKNMFFIQKSKHLNLFFLFYRIKLLLFSFLRAVFMRLWETFACGGGQSAIIQSKSLFFYLFHIVFSSKLNINNQVQQCLTEKSVKVRCGPAAVMPSKPHDATGKPGRRGKQ